MSSATPPRTIDLCRERRDRERMTTRAMIIVLATALAVPAPAPKGLVGVCLRWGASPDHAQEVVVVRPSGNPVLDAALPDSVRQMRWPRPADLKTADAWLGVWMSVDGAPVPPGPPPACDRADQLLPKPQLDTRSA